MKNEHDVVKAAMEKHPMDADAAVEWALSKCLSDKALLSARQNDVWRAHLRKLVQSALGASRSAIRHAPEYAPKDCVRGLKAIGAAADVAAASILDSWRMYDGRALGDFTGAELRSVSEHKSAKARSEMVDARFYALLADKTPAKGKARNYVKPQEAQELLDAARKTTANMQTSGILST